MESQMRVLQLIGVAAGHQLESSPGGMLRRLFSAELMNNSEERRDSEGNDERLGVRLEALSGLLSRGGH